MKSFDTFLSRFIMKKHVKQSKQMLLSPFNKNTDITANTSIKKVTYLGINIVMIRVVHVQPRINHRKLI